MIQKREPRGRKGNVSLTSHHLSDAAEIATLACRAVQPLAKAGADGTHHLDATPSSPED